MDVQHIETCLERTLTFIEKADNKANIQLATCGILLAAISMTPTDCGCIENKLAWLQVLSIGTIALSMFFALICVYPRLTPKIEHGSLIYFDTAVQWEKKALRTALQNADNEKYREETIGQYMENIKVAHRKYFYIRLSSIALIIGSTLTSFYIACSIL